LPVRFDADGLVPAVIQDADRRDVLMVGFMNEEALDATRITGHVHFWSRSRQKLWRKGETSGHEQVVDQIAVNCDQNSLLITVHQIGAVCHDGYPTCYYRRLEPDNSLTTTHDRAFDPGDVYGKSPQPDLAGLTRELMATYALLRDHDVTGLSESSRRLRSPDDTVTLRLAGELSELAGVLDGSHRHQGMREDIALEASQVLYWALLVSLRAGLSWAQLRPDLALAPARDSVHASTLSALIQSDAESWRRQSAHRDVAAHGHASLALVAQACMTAGVEPVDIVAADLEELRSKSYVATLVAQHATFPITMLREAPGTTDSTADEGASTWP
jgi:phosphoribosyl-AMP cyclohydrolase